MSKTQTKLTRRHFLLAATAGTAATAAAVVGKQQTEKASTQAATEPTGKGYQATEHVHNYYRTARV